MANSLKAGSELFNLAIHSDDRFDFWELLNGRKVFSFSPKVVIGIIDPVTDIPEETFTELITSFENLGLSFKNAEDSMRTSLEAFLSTTEEVNRNMQNLGL